MKKIALINSDIAQDIKKYFINKDVEIFETEDFCTTADLFVTDDYCKQLPDNAINIHPSLLPAFEGENSIEKALLAGVKVSGITIHSNKKIIAQYPILIGIDTHIEEFINGIKEIKKQLVPPVIEAILEDKVFDFTDIFNKPCCSKNCSQNCKNCH